MRVFHTLQDKKVFHDQDDKLLFKETKEGRFFVKALYKILDGSISTLFPYCSIWNPEFPLRWVFLLGDLLGEKC